MTVDPFAEIKRQVLERLHPRPRGTRPEVEQKVRHALQDLLRTSEMPLTAADRTKVANDICDTL